MATRPFIGVIDYGRGNLRSVAKALEKVGARVKVSGRPGELAGAAGLLLPGVGAFGDAMAALERRGLAALVRRQVREQRPLLGVCLGLQLFCRDSDEFGRHRGFGFFDLPVRRFGRGLKVPHMGWNAVHDPTGCPLFRGLRPDRPFYFLHSYRVRLDAKVPAARTVYGREAFAAALWRGALFATQFHPEKSQADGLLVYRNYWGLCRQGALRGRAAA
jgi:glutamine amidotransferase